MQHRATWWPNERNMLDSTMLDDVASTCWIRLAGPLSSNITQHNESKRLKTLTKIFSSVKFIETNNVFAIRGKQPFLFQLRACKHETIRVTYHTVCT